MRNLGQRKCWEDDIVPKDKGNNDMKIRKEEMNATNSVEPASIRQPGHPGTFELSKHQHMLPYN